RGVAPIRPFATSSQLPLSAWALSVSIVASSAGLALLVPSMVTWRPTAGAIPVSNASRNASMSRRVASGPVRRVAEVEAGEFQEVEQVVDRAVVRVAEATLAHHAGRVLEAALLVQVAELRDFHVLRRLQRGVIDHLAVGAGGQRVAVDAPQRSIDGRV